MPRQGLLCPAPNQAQANGQASAQPPHSDHPRPNTARSTQEFIHREGLQVAVQVALKPSETAWGFASVNGICSCNVVFSALSPSQTDLT